MFYKHNYKKEEEEKEKEEGFLQKLFQRVKEISFYSYMLSMLIAVLLAICFSIYLEAQKDKRNSAIKKTQTVVQTQIVPKEQFEKKDVYLNETAKLNSNNYEFFISEKDSNRGILLIKASDFIKNNNKVILYKAIRNVIISGNPEIIEKLNFNITNNSNINLKKNTIQIKLDNNRDNNSVLSLQINHEVLTKDELVNDETLLTIEYVESYAD